MNTFLTSNETQWRLARTIVQGILELFDALELDVVLCAPTGRAAA